MKKWLLISTVGISSLLTLIVLSCFYLLATESGANFLVSQARKQLGESLTIGAVRGKVLDRLELDSVLFTSPATGTIQLDHFVLDWKSSELLRLNLHIVELSATALSYTASTQKKEAFPPSETPLVLPELKLPLSIEIDKLDIRGFSFLAAPHSSPLLVDSCLLRLSWDDNGITIQQLQLLSAQGSLAISGSLDPRGSYPMDFSSSLISNHPELPNITMRGEYGGDIKTLLIKENLTGDMEADLQVSLQDVLSDLGWILDLHIKQLQPALFVPELPGILTGKLSGKGSLHNASATGDLHIRSTEDAISNWDAAFDIRSNLDELTLQIKQLLLEHPDSSTRLELSGAASLDKELDLNMHWADIQWPLTGNADYASSTGSLSIKGTVDDYHLQLTDCDFSGNMLPSGQLVLHTDGSSTAATNINLTASLLGGETSLKGQVQWSPVLQWQVTSTAKDMNPGVKYKQWPGKLHWQLASSGSLPEKGLSTELDIVSFGGILREHPLSGTGRISIKEDDILIDALRLSSAASTLKADGSLGDTSNLQWNLSINDLSDLLPDSSGQLQAEGMVQGLMQSPRLDMQLQASSVRFQELTLEELTSDVKLDLSWQEPFSISLNGTALQSGENFIPTVQLQAAGSREEHTIQFMAEHKLATLSLGLEGGYTDERWLGVLSQLAIRSSDMGNWQLQRPAALQLSASAATLQDMCLTREDSKLCVAGSWDAETSDSNGDIAITSVPLQWLTPWLPDPIDTIDGLFSATATIAKKENIQAKINGRITPGSISYTTDQHCEKLLHQGIQFDLQIVENALDASLAMAIDSNSIKASVNSPDISPILSNKDVQIAGKIKVDAKKFDLVEALVPAVQKLDAAIDINLTISGSLHDPKMDGSGSIKIPYVLIPPAGLELKNSILDLQSNNTDLSLMGKLNSPDGSLDLNGKVSLDSAQNFPLELEIKSDNFRLLNLPEMRIFLSSDLLLKRTPELTTLSGELNVPRAEVLLRELPKGSQSISPDVIILQKANEEEGENISPVKMDIKVILGRDVHFAGLGVNAFINGQLSILSEPGEQMLGSGSFSIEQGSFRAYGQDLDIETGIISFPGGPLSQPGINLRATRTIGDVIAGVSALGPAKNPRITTFSNPPMPEGDIISYLLTGSAPNDSGKGTKVSIGRQINNKLSVSMGTDVKTGDSKFITRYRLTRNIHVQTTTAGTGNAADIFYSVELGGEDDVQDRDFNDHPQK